MKTRIDPSTTGTLWCIKCVKVGFRWGSEPDTLRSSSNVRQSFLGEQQGGRRSRARRIAPKRREEHRGEGSEEHPPQYRGPEIFRLFSYKSVHFDAFWRHFGGCKVTPVFLLRSLTADINASKLKTPSRLWRRTGNRSCQLPWQVIYVCVNLFITCAAWSALLSIVTFYLDDVRVSYSNTYTPVDAGVMLRCVVDA